MTWASHPTSQLPTLRRRRPWLAGVILLVVCLLIAGAAVLTSRWLGQPTSTPLPAPADTIPAQSAAVVAAQPSSPLPTQPGAELTDFETQLLDLVNSARSQSGCAQLRLDPSLAEVALAQSNYLARTGQYTHIAPDGKDPGERMTAAGYDTSLGWGETIARRQSTPAQVLEQWLGDTDTRAVILNCALVATGIGVARATDGEIYWTQDFGGR